MVVGSSTQEGEKEELEKPKFEEVKFEIEKNLIIPEKIEEDQAQVKKKHLIKISDQKLIFLFLKFRLR